MKKIGVYGGTFDPIHNGHLSLAADAVDMAGLDDMIFMPVYIQPFKQDKKLTDGNDRLAMLRLAIEEHPAFAVSNYEMRTEGVSYTYKTLRVIKDAYDKDDKLYFICGTDSFIKIETWKNAEELLTKYSYVIGTRPGYKQEELKLCIKRIREAYNTEIINIDNVQIDVSSTEIREILGRGDSAKGLISVEVERYIKEHGLYE